jgi:hypothetical protein
VAALYLQPAMGSPAATTATFDSDRHWRQKRPSTDLLELPEVSEVLTQILKGVKHAAQRQHARARHPARAPARRPGPRVGDHIITCSDHVAS